MPTPKPKLALLGSSRRQGIIPILEMLHDKWRVYSYIHKSPVRLVGMDLQLLRPIYDFDKICAPRHQTTTEEPLLCTRL